MNDIVERTSTTLAPWTLVAGNDKRIARLKVISTVADAMENSLGSPKKSKANGKPKKRNGKLKLKGKRRSRSKGKGKGKGGARANR